MLEIRINNCELRIANCLKARTHDKIVEHVRWLPDVLEVIDLSVQF